MDVSGKDVNAYGSGLFVIFNIQNTNIHQVLLFFSDSHDSILKQVQRIRRSVVNTSRTHMSYSRWYGNTCRCTERGG
jgi:hypothetical protein